MLSVVVPAYDVAEYLPTCLDSILASTLRDLEVIVVDDGSPDECGEIAEAYARFDERVRVLHTANQGLGPARNTGAAAAAGEYITFADSDDFVPPDAYRLLVDSLERTGSDIAAGNAWRHIEGSGDVQSWTHAEAFAEDRPRTHIREFPLLVRDRMVWNKVYRRSFWNAGGYEFPPIRYEDYPVTLRAHLEASAVDVLSTKVYHWRQRLEEGSITQRSLESDNIADRLRSAEMVLDVAEAEGGAIRARVHEYLVDVDIVTLATAIAQAGDRERQRRLEAEAVKFVQRLQPERRASTKLARITFELLRRGDAAGAAAFAQWRRDKDAGALARGLVRRPTIARPIGVLRALIAR